MILDLGARARPAILLSRGPHAQRYPPSVLIGDRSDLLLSVFCLLEFYDSCTLIDGRDSPRLASQRLDLGRNEGPPAARRGAPPGPSEWRHSPHTGRPFGADTTLSLLAISARLRDALRMGAGAGCRGPVDEGRGRQGACVSGVPLEPQLFCHAARRGRPSARLQSATHGPMGPWQVLRRGSSSGLRAAHRPRFRWTFVF